MSNNSVISPAQKIEETTSTAQIKSGSSILFGIASLIFLSSAIGSVLNMAEGFAEDIYKISFIENWMPWIVVAFFASGWFLTHWAEIELSKNRIGVARLLMVTIIVGGFLISAYFKYISKNEVLNDFGLAAFLLIVSGYLLRFSIFREKNQSRLQIVFWS
jgi:hypothetical protein